MHFNFSHSHHGFTELSTVEWLQMLLVWALKSLNKFKMDFLHFGDEAMEKENFLFLGSSFFFISLLQMCCHFSSKLNQWPSVILREFFWIYFGKNYLYENINYLQEFHFQFRMKLLYLEWITLWRETGGLLVLPIFCVIKTQHSVFEALGNQNLSFQISITAPLRRQMSP